MRILFILLIASQALAWDCRKVTLTGGSPLPVAYAGTAPSLVRNGVPKKHKYLKIVNDLAAKFCVNWEEGNTATVPTGGADAKGLTREHCFPSGINHFSDHGIEQISTRIYARSDTGAPLTAGTYEICTQ